jgi:hypothetical protein
LSRRSGPLSAAHRCSPPGADCEGAGAEEAARPRRGSDALRRGCFSARLFCSRQLHVFHPGKGCTECCSPSVPYQPRKAWRSLSPYSLPDRRRRNAGSPPPPASDSRPEYNSRISSSRWRSRSAAPSFRPDPPRHSGIGARHADPRRQQRHVVLRPARSSSPLPRAGAWLDHDARLAAVAVSSRCSPPSARLRKQGTEGAGHRRRGLAALRRGCLSASERRYRPRRAWRVHSHSSCQVLRGNRAVRRWCRVGASAGGIAES